MRTVKVDELEFRKFVINAEKLASFLDYQTSVGRIDYSEHSINLVLQMAENYKKALGDLKTEDNIKNSKYIEQQFPFNQKGD